VVYVVCRQLKIDVGELKQVYHHDEDDDEEDNDDMEDPIQAIKDETTKLVTNGDGKESYITF
jgi:hypothetical protein